MYILTAPIKNLGGRPKNPPKTKEMLKDIIPIDDIFEDDEKKMYLSLVDIYLKDFDKDDLTSSDMDDILSLAMNRVLEIRLLKTGKGQPGKQIDASTAIEKLRKQNDKIKENLSSRRRDRINPNEYKGFSIVDLAVAFEKDKKSSMMKKALGLQKEQDAAAEKFGEFTGNRYDMDVQLDDGENAF
jgi:hypothetical protein